MVQPKEFLYVGHYIDVDGNYILKIGTTNDLDRRQKDHNRTYRKENKGACKMPKDGEGFIYDWTIKLSKYNTIRFEDRNREAWQGLDIGEYVRNDRFNCGKNKPNKVIVTIRKEYEVVL